MRQERTPEDVVACWTLVDADWELVANKSGPTRPGFCLLLKFFEVEARSPEFVEEFPQPAVEYVAGLVKVPAAELGKYDLAGAKRHRKQIREALGFRPATLADEEALTGWPAAEVCPVEPVENRQRDALLVEYRARKIEPPGRTRIEKILVAARGRWESAFCARVIERLGEAGTVRLLSLAVEDNETGAAMTMPTAEKKPVTTAMPNSGMVSPPWASFGKGLASGRSDDAHPGRATVGVVQGADAGAAEPERGVVSEDRPRLAVT
ncbi:DUF4158 domain-containing protein [Streptomyces sp. CB02400]|uniref:DUF4158 domain-containing protein n=1 Tax=Streptomyces sp. CB02400 TaxID=1703944 RepID=UPI00093DAE8C